MTNPIYAGYVTFGRLKPGSGNSIEDLSKWKMAKCEEITPIMTKEEWLATFQMFEKKKQGITSQTIKTEYVLRDLIYCKIVMLPCFQRIKKLGENGKKYGIKKYMCSNKLCKVWFSTDELHALVLIVL